MLWWGCKFVLVIRWPSLAEQIYNIDYIVYWRGLVLIKRRPLPTVHPPMFIRRSTIIQFLSILGSCTAGCHSAYKVIYFPTASFAVLGLSQRRWKGGLRDRRVWRLPSISPTLAMQFQPLTPASAAPEMEILLRKTWNANGRHGHIQGTIMHLARCAVAISDSRINQRASNS